MNDPVAVPIQALKQAVTEAKPTTASEPKGVYLDDSTQNHLSYKATNKVPYLIDYFGLKDFYEVSPQVTQTARELHELLVQNDDETSINETKEILDLMSQELNLQDNDAPLYKLRKTLFLAKVKNDAAELKSKRLLMLANN